MTKKRIGTAKAWHNISTCPQCGEKTIELSETESKKLFDWCGGCEWKSKEISPSSEPFWPYIYDIWKKLNNTVCIECNGLFSVERCL